MTSIFTAKKILGFVLVCWLTSALSAKQVVYITNNNKIGIISDPNNPSPIAGPYYELYLVDPSINSFNAVGLIGFGIPVKSVALPVGERPSNLSVSESNLNAAVSVYPNPAVRFYSNQIRKHDWKTA